MPDLDDVVVALDKLSDAIELVSPSFARSAIAGIEVTQSIQYHDSSAHLSDPTDRGIDNSVTLVAHKSAIVRVYVRPPLLAEAAPAVSGTLLVERGGLFGPYRPVGTYSPEWSNTVTPRKESYADRRGNRWRSLNFRIPASDFVGTMRLTVTLDTGTTATVTVTAALLQTLRVRVILVHYNGPSTAMPVAGLPTTTLDLAAPTLGDAQTTAATAFRAMPVQQTGSFAAASTMNWFVPLDDPRVGAGGCSNNWSSLLWWMKLLRDNDGNRSDVVYYGLLPAGMPVGVPGCGEDGLGAGRAGDEAVFLHEIGHGYGFDHTPSGQVGTPDPAYPDYEPYPSASIGEFGMDTANGTVYPPASSTDYMSYGPMRWMSLYQHNRLIGHTRLAPTWVREKNPFDELPVEYDPRDLWWPNPPWKKDDILTHESRPMISLRGFVSERGVVRVESVARITASATMHGPSTSWSAQLVSATGDVASRGQLTRVDSHGGEACGCGPGAREGNPDRLPFEFHAMIPDTEPGAALQITGPKGESAWEVAAPARPVRFQRAKAAVEGDLLHFSWSHPRGITVDDVWAQWSGDRGETWNGLAIGVEKGAGVELTGIAAGSVLVRLLAHDGFSTAYSEPMEVEVPLRSPELAILYPPDAATVVAGANTAVLGSAIDQAGAPIDDERLSWLLDGTEIGIGRSTSLRLDSGEHELTFAARGGREGATTVRVRAMTFDEAADLG